MPFFFDETHLRSVFGSLRPAPVKWRDLTWLPPLNTDEWRAKGEVFDANHDAWKPNATALNTKERDVREKGY